MDYAHVSKLRKIIVFASLAVVHIIPQQQMTDYKDQMLYIVLVKGTIIGGY